MVSNKPVSAAAPCGQPSSAWSDASRNLLLPAHQPLPRGVWLILALALLARLVAAYYGHWFWRTDESFQYLEQAHRLVFGYGFIPWEYRYDARSWLFVYLVAPPLFVAKWLGIDNPMSYATLVNSWNALLSMSVPVCSYLAVRRMFSERVARVALLFTCFWYEFIVLAPRVLTEIYATYCFIGALAAGAGERRGRWVAAGFLLGLCVALRPHYAPVAGLLGLLWLWRLPATLFMTSVAGGVAALVLWGMIDFFTTGQWWGSVINYSRYVGILFGDVAANKAVSRPWAEIYPYQLIAASGGLYVVFLLLGFCYFRHLKLLLPLILLPLGIYFILNGRGWSGEYGNLYIFLPLLWILAAALIVLLHETSKRAARLGGCVIAALSAAGLAGLLPFITFTKNIESYFAPAPLVKVAYRLHEHIEKTDSSVLVWVTDSPLLESGGFYSLHINTPVIFLSDARHNVLDPTLVVGKRVHDLQHQAIWQLAATDMDDFATHVVASPSFAEAHPDFTAVPLTEEYTLYINNTVPSYPVADEWIYDYINPGLDTHNKLPPPAYTLYNPDL